MGAWRMSWLAARNRKPEPEPAQAARSALSLVATATRPGLIVANTSPENASGAMRCSCLAASRTGYVARVWTEGTRFEVNGWSKSRYQRPGNRARCDFGGRGHD